MPDNATVTRWRTCEGRYCTNNKCLICRLGVRPIAATSTSYPKRRLVANEGNMGDGNSRRKRAPTADFVRQGGPSEYATDVELSPKQGCICPICRKRVKNLTHHYNKSHQGERAVLADTGKRI